MDHYYRKVFYSEEDAGWIAIAPELPGCSAFGASPAKALSELETAMRLWLEVARQDGKIPAPIADKGERGTLVLRVPKSLQRELKEDAAEQGVSLNKYATYILTRGRERPKVQIFREKKKGGSNGR